MQEVRGKVTSAFELFKSSNFPRLQDKSPGSPSTGPEVSSRDSTTTTEASDGCAGNDVGGGRSISLLAFQAGASEALAAPERNSSFFVPAWFLAFLAVLNTKNSASHHQDGAPPSALGDTQHADGSTHSVDLTSAGMSRAAIVEDGDPRPRRIDIFRPRITTGAGRTWFILLSMIGAFFLCFWLIHPLSDFDARAAEPTEQGSAYADAIDFGAIETNEVKELLEDEAPL